MSTGRGLAISVNMDNIKSSQGDPFIYCIWITNQEKVTAILYSEILITALPGTISPGSQLTPNHTHHLLSAASMVNINVDYTWWILESNLMSSVAKFSNTINNTPFVFIQKVGVPEIGMKKRNQNYKGWNSKMDQTHIQSLFQDKILSSPHQRFQSTLMQRSNPWTVI